jgi:hypothetical protein
MFGVDATSPAVLRQLLVPQSSDVMLAYHRLISMQLEPS